MLVVACVKQVPDTTQVKVDPVTGTLIREGVPFITNPFDTHALEESLKLKDAYGFRVVTISMGPPSAEATLRKTLALGADEAILLSDRVFGGADTLATSKVLSEAIQRLAQKEEVAMVICGKQTIDGDTAQVGPGIATRLKYAQLTLVDQIGGLADSYLLPSVRGELLSRLGRQSEAASAFADMFAQTLAYGLFSARASSASTGFTRAKAQKLIPRTNPFLRSFFEQITGAALDDEPFAGFVEDLIQTLDHADMARKDRGLNKED